MDLPIISHAAQQQADNSIARFTVQNLIDEPEFFAQWSGNVLLIVNTASACGFTPQYAQLQELHEKYTDKGLKIIAFPCNQFGAQEPGDAEQIGAFCTTHFHVTFPVMAKIKVNGSDTAPLWQWLKARAPGILGTQRIKWNFTKFLVAKDGISVSRFAPMTKPLELSAQIEQLLAQ